MFLCVSGTCKKVFGAWALIEAEILTSPLPHVFADLGLVLGTGTLPTGVSTPPKWSNNGPIYLRNLQMVFSAWGPDRSWDIDLPTPNVFAQLGLGLGAGALTMGVSTSLRWSGMFLCVPGMSKKLVHQALMDTKILTSLPQNVFAQLGPALATGTLSAGVSTPHKLSRNVSMCLRNVQKIGASGLNGCQDIGLPTPNVFAQLGPALATGTLPAGVSTPCKWSRNVPICLRYLQKQFGAWGLKGSWDIELLTPNVIAQLVPALGTGILPAGVLIPHSGVEMFLCVSGTSKPNLVHEALMEAEHIDLPTLHVFVQLGLDFGC